MPFRRTSSSLPLTPVDFEILLALAEHDLHGYAILQAVETRIRQVLPLRTGTLYRALARLLDAGFLAELSAEKADDPRRRTYHITAEGRAVARAEAQRLADQVSVARARKLLSEDRR